jgi:hypothetical protein
MSLVMPPGFNGFMPPYPLRILSPDEGVPRSDEEAFDPVWESQKVDSGMNGVDGAPWPT